MPFSSQVEMIDLEEYSHLHESYLTRDMFINSSKYMGFSIWRLHFSTCSLLLPMVGGQESLRLECRPGSRGKFYQEELGRTRYSKGAH